MLYIQIFKTVYLIIITSNLVLLYYKGPAFKNFFLLQFGVNCTAILANIITFYWMNKGVAILLEKVLSAIRMVVILLIASIVFIGPVITIIPTGYVLWFNLLQLLDIYKIKAPLGTVCIWMVCVSLFILEVLFFRELTRLRKRVD